MSINSNVIILKNFYLDCSAAVLVLVLLTFAFSYRDRHTKKKRKTKLVMGAKGVKETEKI